MSKKKPDFEKLIPDYLSKAKEINEKKNIREEEEPKEKKKTKRKTPQKMIGVNLPTELYGKFLDYAFSVQETSLSKVFRDFLKTLFENKEVLKEFSEFLKGYVEEKPFKDYKMTMLVLDDETEKIFNNYVFALRVRPRAKLARAIISFMVTRGEK